MTFKNNNSLFKKLTGFINAVSGKFQGLTYMRCNIMPILIRTVRNIKDLISVRAVQYTDGWDVNTSGAIRRLMF
jgi:hypothetical protein